MYLFARIRGVLGCCMWCIGRCIVGCSHRIGLVCLLGIAGGVVVVVVVPVVSERGGIAGPVPTLPSGLLLPSLLPAVDLSHPSSLSLPAVVCCIQCC